MSRPLVYVSTGYFKNYKSKSIIEKFKKNKLNNIELSGGKFLTKKEIRNLRLLLDKCKLRIHNYFPPPKNKVVINLASDNKQVIKRSLNQIKKSIILSKILKNKYFSFHAGFRMDPLPKNLGKKFRKNKIISKKRAEKIFLDNLKYINKFSRKHKIKILIENNVINKKNFDIYGENPLLLTNPKDILDFFKKVPKDIGLLLDLGHLKVSAKTERFNHVDGLKKLNSLVKGYHMSDNGGLEDENKTFGKKAWFINDLKRNLDYYTLEIYTNKLSKILKAKRLVENYLSN